MDERLRNFVEGVTGARVERAERLGSGASRAIWAVRLSSGAERVLRVDTGDGPLSGTELTLAREAAAYAALSGGPLPIPRLIAASAEVDALLVERAPGSESFDGLDPAAGARVMDGYVDALAVLHGIEAERLELPGFARPTREEPAGPELALWRGVLEARVRRPAPLARFAFAWLERNAPRHADRISLCHGDVGPGNFLHENERVTALLDWEFAHLGDPLDDLGWLAFRGHHLNDGVGDLAPQLRRWSERTGLPADAQRIAWYRALVMLRMLVSCQAALDSGAASLDRTVYFSLSALLGVLLPQALAQLAGVTLRPAPAAPAGRVSDETEVMASVLAEFGGQVLPALPAAQQRRARGLTLLLLHLQAAERFGESVRASERELLARALGRDESEPAQRLAARVSAAPAAEDADWLRLFAELGALRIGLWPFLAGIAAKPLATLD